MTGSVVTLGVPMEPKNALGDLCGRVARADTAGVNCARRHGKPQSLSLAGRWFNRRRRTTRSS